MGDSHEDIEAQTQIVQGDNSQCRIAFIGRLILRPSPRNSNRYEDAIELQDQTQAPEPSAPSSLGDERLAAYHRDAISLLFGLPSNYGKQWPGIEMFLKYLEEQFSVLIEQKYDVIWKVLDRPIPGDPNLVWEWCLRVVAAFSDQGGDTVSIEDVYRKLINQGRLSGCNLGASEVEDVHRAIFAVLCWTSMALRPSLRRGAPTQPRPWAENSDHTLPVHYLRRSVLKILPRFRQGLNERQRLSSFVPPNASTQPSHPSDIIYESSINYFSLHNVGHVDLDWVDTITSHLRFNRRTRTLSLFRLPSLCLASVMSAEDASVFTKILQEFFPLEQHPDDSDGQVDSYSAHREILLSYRLLFAQSRRSRRLVSHQLENLKSQGKLDPLLKMLSGTSLPSLRSKLPRNVFPHSTLSAEGTLQESDTYSAREDFPSFGYRLLILQRYNLRQQPSRVKDLWRDRRNPLQWYTFWAVVWVGGISIIFSILQFLVGAAQLYLAAMSRG